MRLSGYTVLRLYGYCFYIGYSGYIGYYRKTAKPPNRSTA